MTLAASIGPYGIALIGALGALIGGVITAGSNLLIEWSRRRSERGSVEEKDAREVRRAARLVLEELSGMSRAMQTPVETKRPWPETLDPSFSDWNEYRAVLAVHVSDEAWKWLTSAYGQARSVSDRVKELREEEFVSRDIRQVVIDDVEWLRQPFVAVRYAMETLERTMGPGAGVYRYTGYASVEEIERHLFGERPEAVEPDPD